MSRSLISRAVLLQHTQSRLPSPVWPIVGLLVTFLVACTDCFCFSYGSAGFVIYWMMTWMAMSALGGAVESLITIMTPRFLPLFLLLWIICALFYNICNGHQLTRVHFTSERLCVHIPASATSKHLQLRIRHAILQRPADRPGSHIRYT